MYTLKFNSADPYSALIESFIGKDFPRRLASNSSVLIDILTDEILGTKQTRYGPKPGPESLVAIRDVVRHYVSNGEPIPFMVPWGSEKPDGSSIDVAELAALKQLSCFNARITPHYQPGIRANIRLEDVSAPYLFSDDPDTARSNAARYTTDFGTLVKVLGHEFIKVVPESSLTDEETFNQAADNVVGYFEKALRMYDAFENAEAGTLLAQIGWVGGIAPETRLFYYNQYEKLYPRHSHSAKLSILARYFASASARRKLSIRGDESAWEGRFLDLSFVGPTPGTEAYFGRRVYYRTLPLEFTSNHIAPWRAKGYLSIGNDNTVTPKLATFGDKKPYNHNVVTLHNESVGVDVTTDYILT
jgi:hypothetical protein